MFEISNKLTVDLLHKVSAKVENFRPADSSVERTSFALKEVMLSEICTHTHASLSLSLSTTAASARIKAEQLLPVKLRKICWLAGGLPVCAPVCEIGLNLR